MNNNNGNGSDALFEIIKSELNKIVEHGEQIQVSSKRTPKVLSNEKSPSAEQPIKQTAEQNESATSSRMAGGEGGGGGGVPVVDSSIKPKEISSQLDIKLEELGKKYKSTLEKDIAAQTAALDSPRTKCIDADLQKMQLELQESYDVFQEISEKFETIDFSRLQKRIKDLNLMAKCDAVGRNRSDELKRAVDEGFQTNRLNELTNEMGQRFRRHPGEFGNIPELSSFFQACNQLEHCLDGLKRQRNDVRNLEERMRRAAEISYNRVNYIKQQLAEDNIDNDDIELRRH